MNFLEHPVAHRDLRATDRLNDRLVNLTARALGESGVCLLTPDFGRDALEVVTHRWGEAFGWPETERVLVVESDLDGHERLKLPSSSSVVTPASVRDLVGRSRFVRSYQHTLLALLTRYLAAALRIRLQGLETAILNGPNDFCVKRWTSADEPAVFPGTLLLVHWTSGIHVHTWVNGRESGVNIPVSTEQWALIAGNHLRRLSGARVPAPKVQLAPAASSDWPVVVGVTKVYPKNV